MPAKLKETDEYLSVLLQSFQWRYANKYDSWSPGRSGDRGLDAAYAMMLSSAGEGGRSRVLDIGTGTGERLARYLPDQCIAIGLDLIGQPMWPALADGYDGTLTFEEANFFTWTPPAMKFDVVIDSGIMHHQHPSTYRIYLEKIREILAPEGVFGVLVYKEQEQRSKGSMQKTDHGRLCKNFTEPELRRLLSLSGFEPFRTATVARNDGVPYLVACNHIVDRAAK